MRNIINWLQALVFAGLMILLAAQSCSNSGGQDSVSDSLAIRKKYATSPVLSAEEAIKKMHVEDGFAVKLVAAEPLVNAPVAVAFDENGRMWVAEMETFMLDTAGTNEELPVSQIAILTDKNDDGVMDERKVFLDSLVLPRAICLIENGILVAESPNLWFYEIQNDRPGKRTLVDSTYAKGGSVEHQPNGLLRGIDNWIYSAKSSKRYRKKGDKWIIERTHFRGQWGITQDELGRLYYNTNTENLLGDFFSPGLGGYNEHQQSVEGFNEKIVKDNRIYTARANTGVNRGYMEGILNDSLRLVNFTSACAPAIYNGSLFGKEYKGNAFVAEPAANIIKRNVLNSNGNFTGGKHAYANREFVASEDERFRPVNLYEGPDGALYIIDMYRGIIQDKVFITPYLKNEVRERNLTEPLTYGRIYKVVPENKETKKVKITKDPAALVGLLQSESGWIRNKAQQLLVDGKYTQVTPQLQELLKRTDEPVTIIHAMWTLEGLGVLKPEQVLALLQQKVWPLRMQALNVLPSVMNQKNLALFVPALQKMVQQNDTLAAPYIAFLTNNIRTLNPVAAKQLSFALIKKYPANQYITDALISTLYNKEAQFYKELTMAMTDTSLLIGKQLKKLMEDVAKAKNNKNIKQLERQYPRGVALFQTTCQACHGANGNGVRALGPPLNNSQWVVGDKNKLIAIVLYGLTGPVTVGDKLYKVPEISGEMPAIGQNKEVTDEDIAQTLNFIRNSWSNKADKITASDVIATRNKYKDRQKAFTQEELNNLK